MIDVPAACQLHGHAEGSDPRHAGRCVRCGQPTFRLRNRELERELTEHAAHGVCDPSGLVEFSQARADWQGSRLTLGRDWLHEAREELADCCNYLCWWLEDHLGDERAGVVAGALREVCVAFDRLSAD